VDAAVIGDVIKVTAGMYPEHVAVNKQLTVNGANSGVAGNAIRGLESIVNGTDTDAAFAITANGVTLNGFTVENGSGGSYASGIWVQSGTQNFILSNNIITQNGFGVWAQC
jgi:nitrous oxidase accessory protein NosD